jgi:GNAT superfamily N-acetyltransferase
MVQEDFEVFSINKETQYMAKQIINQGLFEHFGHINEDLIPDTHNLYETYILNGDSFLIGKYKGLYMCTGGLTVEATGIGRIVRLSVLKDFRGKGFAQVMIKSIEAESLRKNITQLVLETNENWTSAIGLYSRMGYVPIDRRNGCIHFNKYLTKQTI